MQRLDNEACHTELQAQSPRTEASLTENEKQTLLNAAVDSLKKLGVIDYKLIREIEDKYPRPTNNRTRIDLTARDQLDRSYHHSGVESGCYFTEVECTLSTIR